MGAVSDNRGAEGGEDLKPKLIGGLVLVVVLIAVVIGIFLLVPGLVGVRSAIAGASLEWVLASFFIQLLGVAGAVVFVQAVFDELPRRLTWWQGWGMQGANAVLPTAGGTAVSYWSVNA